MRSRGCCVDGPGAVDAGSVGINLEDSEADRTLVTPERHAERIRAGRDTADALGVPDFFINARTDVCLLQIDAQACRTDDVAARSWTYVEAGANSLFVTGLLNLEVLTRLDSAATLPVNAMAGPGGPSAKELAAVGVRQVSVGTAIAQAAYGSAERATPGNYSAPGPPARSMRGRPARS
jgi:2-methylisocitrate lyase-like PEP mutase family enzyme